MSKRMWVKKTALSLVATFLISVAVVPAIGYAAPYGTDAYGACEFQTGCSAESTTDDTDDDGLSLTGENQRLIMFAGLILVGTAIIVYTIKRKRAYKLKS